MTVKELKQNLNSFPDHTVVVVRGYEGGYNDISSLRTVNIKTKKNSHWYDGEYYDSDDAENSIAAIDLFGKNNNAIDL